MRYKPLGRCGLQVSEVGLGCNNFGWVIGLEAAREVIDAALDAGVTLFDTADVYGGGESERALGQVLEGRRKDVLIATKFALPMAGGSSPVQASRRYIMSAVEASLERLRTDWIDLYQIHFPDPKTPIEETMRALDDLVRQGKVRHVGCSNFQAWRVVDAAWTSRHGGLSPLVSTQAEYSLIQRGPEAELIPALAAGGIALLPYYPLASGILTGKYKRGAVAPDGTRLKSQPFFRDRHFNERNLLLAERLEKFASERGHSVVELAFSWLSSQPVVGSVIAGATRREQVIQNAKAVAWSLTQDDLKEIDTITAS